MTKTQVGVLAALVVAVVVAAIAAAVTLGREDEPGTDAHVHIEPISTADEVAVAAISGLHTWTPATQQSPWDAMNAIADQLTGPWPRLHQLVLTPIRPRGSGRRGPGRVTASSEWPPLAPIRTRSPMRRARPREWSTSGRRCCTRTAQQRLWSRSP